MPNDAPGHALVVLALLGLLLSAVACGSRPAESGGTGAASESDAISAFQPVADIFASSCATSACHSAARGAGQLVLSADVARENLVDVPSDQKDGAVLVVPGEPDSSYLMAKLRGDEGILGSRMPIGRSPLSDEELATISGWIADGAVE